MVGVRLAELFSQTLPWCRARLERVLDHFFLGKERHEFLLSHGVYLGYGSLAAESVVH